MGIDGPFQNQEEAIASYNYVDIISGTGITNMFAGMTTNLAGTVNHILSNNEFYSKPIIISVGMTAGGTYTKDIDVDFDVTINRPTIVEGKVVVNVPFYMIAAVNPGFAYVHVRLRKYNGAIETEIADNTGHVNEVEGTYNLASIFLDIPKTQYKAGELLRLTIEVWAKGGDSNPTNSNVAIAADPKNRTTDWDGSGVVPSQLIFQLPTRIDL